MLPKASCKNCRDRTSFVELDILRNLLKPYRVAAEIPTRRPKEIPKLFPIKGFRNGREFDMCIPIAEHPVPIILPIFRPPAWIDNRQYAGGAEVIQAVYILPKGNPPVEEMKRKYSIDEIAFDVSFHPISVLRFVTKIAYGYAVAGLGLKSFAKIYVTKAILGETEDIGMWAGNISSDYTNPTSDGHKINIKIRDGKYITAGVQLFCNYGCPEYYVILGELDPEIDIQSLKQAHFPSS